MRILPKIALLSIGAMLVTAAALLVVGAAAAKRQYLAGVDRQLNAAGASLPAVVGDDYLRRATSDQQIKPDEYNALVLRLSDLADREGVTYLYMFTPRGDQFLNILTSASPKERKDSSWATYLSPYAKPPPEIRETLADGRNRFAEYTDEFGSFRSIFIRGGAGANTYVVGVDVSLARIHDDLLSLLFRSISAALAVGVGVGLVCVLLTRGIVRPLQTLTHEVDAWAGRDFARDDAIRARLERIGRNHHDEIGELAGRFVDVQARLDKHLVDLTRTTAEKKQIEHQLEIAKTIQESLLPSDKPNNQHFKIFGWCQPADQTGGDYFDWVEMPDGKLMVTIGDVTGHGIGPALVTAASRAYGRATLNSEEGLSLLVGKLNDLLYTDLKGIRFVTLIAGLLDPEARSIKLVAAGHGPMFFYCKASDAIELYEETQGTPLGVFGNVEYDAPIQLKFAPGDVLVLVSDGFLDWMDPTGETFGNARLAKSALDTCRVDPDAFVERLLADIARFNQGRPKADDTTALVIRCVS